MRRIATFFILCQTVLYSYSNVTTGGDPSAMLLNHFNLVTGQMVEHRHDLILDGIEPVYLDAYYDAHLSYIDQGGEWRIFPHTELTLTPNRKAIIYTDERGNRLQFDYAGSNKYKLNLPRDMTNTFAGRPSGQTDIRNLKIRDMARNKTIEVIKGDGTKLIYRRYKIDKKGLYYRLKLERRRSGRYLQYGYGRFGRVKKIEVLNPSRSKKYGEVTFSRGGEKESNFSIKTSSHENQIFHYWFCDIGKKGQGMKSASPPYAHKQVYSWGRKWDGFKQLLKIDSYRYSINFKIFAENMLPHERGKVRQIYWGVDDIPDKNNDIKPRHNFAYIVAQRQDGSLKKDDNHTIVLDREKKKELSYHFDRNSIPEQIKTFNIKGDREVLSSIEKFHWSGDSFHQLKAKELRGGYHGPFHRFIKYGYDAHHNISSEKVKGKIRGYQAEETLESRFEYDQYNRCTKQIHPDGAYETTSYWKESHSPHIILLHNAKGEICHRKIIVYDEDYLPIFEGEDDGKNGDLTDLSTPNWSTYTKRTFNERGFPIKVKTPQSTIDYWYDAHGRVVKKIENGMTQNYQYEWRGNCIKETDKKGRLIERKFDSVNNCIEESYLGVTTRYTYNGMNCLEKTTIETPSGTRTSSSTYDYKRRKTSDTDYRGCVTHYRHDHVGNVMQVITDQTTSFTYDGFGNVTQVTNPLGQTTSTTYNALDQPLTITDPLNRTTQKFYNTRGNVEKEIAPNGNSTTTEYDHFLRPILTKTISPSGELLELVSSRYDGPLLKEETDIEGIKTTYAYDPLNRLIEKRRNDSVTTFKYDGQNRIKTKNQNGIETHYTYDVLDQILTETTGNCCISYTYDDFGNTTSKTIGESTDHYTYDHFGRLTSHTDPLGATTTYSYTDFTKTTFSSKQTKTIETFDRHDNLIDLKTYDDNHLIRHEEYTYDPLNRKISQTTHVIPQGVIHLIKWEYDAAGNCTRLEEGGRVTHKSYTIDNLVQMVVKPDQTKINYSYDAAGNLKILKTADIEYHYTYDQKHRLIQVEDKKQNTTHTMEYDVNSNLSAETLANGLTLMRTFDSLNRITSLTLPNEETISYTYDQQHLKSIDYLNHTHTYDTYAPSGLCTQQTLPLNLGSLTTTSDRALRPNAFQFEEISQSIERDIEGCITASHISLPQSDYHSTYTYDRLHQLTNESGHFNANYSHNSLYTAHGTPCIPNEKYDQNGNQLTFQGFTYTYDGLDRLTTITSPDNDTTTLTYDSQNRIMTINQNQKLIYNQKLEIGSYLNDKLTELRILGPTPFAEIGATVLLILDDTPYVPIHDLFGNPLALYTSSGPIQLTPTSAFGLQETTTADNTIAQPISPYRYQSKRSIGNLIYFGQRFYNPTTHTFLNPDPKLIHPNTYHYLLNNPLTHHDPWGLEPTGADSIYYNRHRIGPPTKTEYEVSQLLYENNRSFSKHDIQMASNPFFESNKPYYLQNELGAKAFRASLGRADLTVGSIGYENGICNTYEDYCKTTMSLSSMGGDINIRGVYNPTHGFARDINDAYSNFFLNSAGGPTFEKMVDIIDRVALLPQDRGYILEIVHSKGTASMLNTLKLLPQDIRNRVRVVAIAPCAYIPQDLCHSVMHYISRDIVPHTDPRLQNKHDPTVKRLESHHGASLNNHTILSPTYTPALHDEISDYIKVSSTW